MEFELKAERPIIEVTRGPGPWGAGDWYRKFVPGEPTYWLTVKGIDIPIDHETYVRLLEVVQ